MITIYNKNESDLTTLGLGTINASECTVSENAGGAFDLQMTVPCEEDMKYTWLENGRILKVDCPVRETPIAQQTKGNVTRKIYKVDTGASGIRLYLRSAPDQNSKGIHAYRPNTEVAMLDDSDRNWMKVAVLDGGNVGYMWKGNLVFVRNETENVSGDNPSVIIKPTQYRKQFFRIYKVEKDSKTNSIKVDARHIFYDLVGNVIKGKYEFENKAANVVLNDILALCTNDNPFNFYCYSTENITGEFENIGLVEALLDPEKGIVKLSNSRIVRDNFDVYIIPDVVRDRGVSIRAGKNLTGVRFTVDDSNVVTRIIPMGSDKKGETVYIDGNGYVDSPLINNYATVHAKAINYGISVGDEFKNVEAVKAEITRLANEDFANGCDLESVSLDVDFVMLGDTEEYSDFEKLQSIHLYDTVHVYYGRIGVSAAIRMNGYDYDAIAKRYSDVRLGDITDINDTVYSYNISDSAIGTQKIARGAVTTNSIANGAVNGAKIPLAAINIAHIDQASINQLTADSIIAVKAEIQRIVAGEITTDELYANLAKIAVAQITTANINNANIDWASIQNLSAQIADIANAAIGTASISYAKIKDLTTDTAIITEGVGGQLYINRLAVTDANMVSLTTGELMLKAADGSFVRLIADGHGGVTTQTVQVEGDNIADATISGGKIIENSITARELNVANIFADQALIRAIKAANIDVANLFAAEATIAALDAYIIKASTITALKGQLDVWASNKISIGIRETGINSNLMIGTENTASIAKKEESASIFYAYGADYPDKLLRIENGTDQEFSVYATITNLKAGQTYTFSVDVINFGNDIRLSVAGLYSDWQTWDNSVRRLSFTFVATGATHNPHVICRRRSGGDGYFDVRKFKIELGSTATAWRKSDEEFRAGSSVEITRDEVRFDTDRFSVHTGDAGDMAIDKDGMSIGNITATRSLTAPNVAYRLNGGTYHVGSGKAYATLDQVFAEINDRTLIDSVSIYIDDPVVYGEATLKGVSGSGEVFIYGQGHTWVGNSTISECNSYVRFDKLTIQGTSGTNGMNVSCCKFVKFVDTIFDGNNKLSEASLHIVASRVDLSNVDVYRSPYHLYAEYSTLSTDNLKGGESGTSWMRGHDNVMTVRASKPLGTMDGTRCIVMPDLGTVAVNAGKSVNPQQEAVTVTLSPTDWRYHYGSWSADKPSQLYQGMYGSDKYRAVYWFNNSGLTGKVIKTATLTLTRVSGSGSGAAIDIHLWGTPLALASGNPTTNRQDYGIIGKLAYGETKEFTIPLAAAQAIAAGSIKALMIDSNESVINSRGYSDNYGKLESATTLKVTY